MNCVEMVGRLANDPQVRELVRKGKQGNKYTVRMAKFLLAVERRKDLIKGDDPTTDFFNCFVLGPSADFMEKYCRKGLKVAIHGSLRNNFYNDENGKRHYDYNIYATYVEATESQAEFQAQMDMGKLANTPPEYLGIPGNVGDEEFY